MIFLQVGNSGLKMQKENTNSGEVQHQYVGPYRLEKTLGKGQTGKYIFFLSRYRVLIHKKKLKIK